MTNLKRAGPPRAGPMGPLTMKAPAATGALWSNRKDLVCGKHSAFSDGSVKVADDRCPETVTGGQHV